MKFSDYVIDFLAENGVGTVFGLTGGAVVHFYDSISKNSKINAIYCHHEQAAAFAAVTYAKVRNSFGATIVTTGPGGTNSLTGLLSAWQDSIPCIFISGQTRLGHTSHGKNLRQIGSQEFDIIGLVKPITKYALMIDDPLTIRYHLEKALYMAKDGRPGPIWIDIPLNFQWTEIDIDKLESFKPSESMPKVDLVKSLSKDVETVINLLHNSTRPLILAGYGIRLAQAEIDFLELVEKNKLPFVASYTASDMIGTDTHGYIGRPGVSGQRGANLAVQNCDLLIAIGSHLSIPLTGTIFSAFARKAKIVMIDIDPEELAYETVRVDLKINCDAKVFLNELNIKLRNEVISYYDDWERFCQLYKSYNYEKNSWIDPLDFVNPYLFMDILSDQLNSKDTMVVDGAGTVFYTCFQAFKTKKGQRLLASTGIAAMGTGLPESIGACIAQNFERTITICGDGSMQLNIQELQTIFHHKLNIKIFVFNNGGYLAIRQTQDGFLKSNYAGTSVEGGISLPDFQKVSYAYGIPSLIIRNHSEMLEKIKFALEQVGPVLCEILINPKEQVIPRQGFTERKDGTFVPRPLEDMYPYLDRVEFSKIMIIEPWNE